MLLLTVRMCRTEHLIGSHSSIFKTAKVINKHFYVLNCEAVKLSNSLGKSVSHTHTHTFIIPMRTKLQTVDTNRDFFFLLKKLHFVWPLASFLAYQLIKKMAMRQGYSIH